MAQDLKYGTVTTERGSIPDDEPVFLLRGRDALAAFALDAYWEAACMTCRAEGFRDKVDQVRASFRKWPLKELPD